MSLKKNMTETPLMVQHKSIKARFPDAILLFRVGDFYETFGDDAVVASKVLGITLTKRNNGSASSMALAGFPHHALETYLHKLVKSGYRVAICDQLEDPKAAKGIVKRGVTEVVTPGIAGDEKLLDRSSNNFLCGLYKVDQEYGLAFVDVSTGDFFVAEGNEEYAEKLLQSLKPAEVIFCKSFMPYFKERFGAQFFTYPLEDWIFGEDYGRGKLLEQFEVYSLKGFGIDHLKKAIVASGAIIHYLRETEHHNLKQLNHIQRIDKDDFLWMDQFTIRNLELVNTGGGNDLSLFGVMNNTITPMGSRILKRWLVFPLKNKQILEDRLGAVTYFLDHEERQKWFRDKIELLGDMERFISKIPLKKITPREVRHIAKGLEIIEEIKKTFEGCENKFIGKLVDILHPCLYIKEVILKTLVDNVALLGQKGEMVQRGVNAELDELKDLLLNAKQNLQILQEKESKESGIGSLKISFNNVFGYYLEVSNTHKNKVPASWIRKQTLANAERYITPELKIFEEKILGAEEKIIEIEGMIYHQILIDLQEYIKAIQLNAQSVGQLDCLSTFAYNARVYGYCKPEISEGYDLEIIEGRHPVIEQHLKHGEKYVSNSVKMAVETCQIMILTGPNMSGKSALLRQVALSVLMTHVGSYIPAEGAIIPLTDKIFTRVGANDNISAGESTFMVEMNETASILNNISGRSLVILDEIGRGTSTFDGISIAWSMVEYLHHFVDLRPKTLFATHYHELNEIEKKLPRVKNYHIAYTESQNKVIFLRKLKLGGIKNSFGIQVAKMAGFPPAIIERAKQILKELEVDHVSSGFKAVSSPPIQVEVVDDKTEKIKRIDGLVKALDINALSPIEALIKLNELLRVLNE